jgi:hypothetical protein
MKVILYGAAEAISVSTENLFVRGRSEKSDAEATEKFPPADLLNVCENLYL